MPSLHCTEPKTITGLDGTRQHEYSQRQRSKSVQCETATRQHQSASHDRETNILDSSECFRFGWLLPIAFDQIETPEGKNWV
ncbi:hypothetical protein BST61_g1685 [Cercospora zeina]